MRKEAELFIKQEMNLNNGTGNLRGVNDGKLCHYSLK